MSGSDTLGLLPALYDQWKNEEFTDLRVIVEDREFKCHSVVLCACSDFFKAMMRSNMKESQEGVVHLQGMAAETFSMLLESMYKDFIDLTNENVLDIWHASCQLQINSVMEKCETFICDQYMTAENCVLLYFHAKQLSVEKIAEKALDCICNNFEQVAKTDSFLDASHDDVFQIINREDLKIKSEDSVIEFILKWVSHVELNTSALDENSSKYMYTQNQGKRTEARGQTEKVRDRELVDQREAKNMELTLAGSKVEASAMPTNITAHCTKEENGAEEMPMGDQHVVEKEVTVDTETNSDVKLQKYPRSKYLQKFLGLSRICLASKYFLEKLLKHELVKRQKEVYNRVFEALLYKLDVGRRHGSWAQTAIHRSTSSMRHAMVFAQSGSCFIGNCRHSDPVMAYILDERSVGYYTSVPIYRGETCENITMFDNKTLVVGLYSHRKGQKIRLYNEIGGWQDIGLGVQGTWSNSNTCLLAHDHYIYRGKDNGYCSRLERLDMTYAIAGRWSDPSFLRIQFSEIQSVVPFEQYIIAFSDDSTCITVMDTVSECHIQVPSIGRPMENIISFNDHENTCTYILQTDGKLWKILHSDTLHRVKFEHVAKLWNIYWKIHGGIFYKGTLFIFGMEESEQGDVNVRQTCVPGIFENIEYVFISSLARCVPMVISNYTPVL